jgi:transposase
MSGKRKQYTQEFKDSAVKLVTEQGYQLSEASRNLGVNISVLRRWKRATETGGISSVMALTNEDLQAELARLKKENHRLKLEREILKKAAVFFPKESGSGIDL